jgi:predicted amidophosphoribosyltransferase
MIDNLNFIKENGMDRFLENEQKRWTCDVCGSGISVHRDFCLNCKTELKHNFW